MSSWLSIPQLVDAAIAEDAGREVTTSSDWIEAETGAGGVVTPPAPASSGLSWQELGAITYGVGGAAAAVGAFFSVRSEQSKLKAQSLSLEHEAAMSAINARAAEREAQSIIEGSQRDIAAVTLRGGAERASLRAQTGGSGALVGAGSAAEVEASMKLIQELDVMAIRTNAARGAAAARTQGVNERNRGALASMSARNLRRTAGNDLTSVSALQTSLLLSGSRLGAQWATDRYSRRA